MVGDTALGTTPEFQSMVKTAKQYGVRLIGDLVINHRSGTNQGTDTTGATFAEYEYPDGAGQEDFHQFPGPRGIEDYGDRWQVQNRELVGLDDLATETPDVRLRIAVGVSLAALEGLDAFRVDAAKHMPEGDLQAIFSLVHDILIAVRTGDRTALDALPCAKDLDAAQRDEIYKPLAAYSKTQIEKAIGGSDGKFWLFQEVIDMGGEAISSSEYLPVGAVIEFKFCRIGDKLRSGTLDTLKGIGGVLLDDQGQPVTTDEWRDLLPSDKAVVVVSNHDNQRGHGGGGAPLTFKEPHLYELAHVFMLGWPYGTPVVMSSYDFTDADAGRPADRSKWVDEDQWPAIAHMMKFRRDTDGTPAQNWWSNSYNCIAFSRGSRGFVAMSTEAFPVDVRTKTGLPDGEYFNIAGEYDDDSPTIRVKGGIVECTVEPSSAIALSIEARKSTRWWLD